MSVKMNYGFLILSFLFFIFRAVSQRIRVIVARKVATKVHQALIIKCLKAQVNPLKVLLLS